MRSTMSYLESIEYLKTLISIYEQTVDKKRAFDIKGESSIEVEREIERILNDVRFITGERNVQLAKTVVSQYDNRK